MKLLLVTSLLFSCTPNSSESKVRIFVSWPGGEGLPHYQWKKGEPEPTGIEPRFIERILEVANLEYEYITDFQFSGDGDPRMEALTSGSADICIRAITINPEREKNVFFTDSYYTDGLSALVRKSDSIESLSDLKGKRVYTLEFTSAYNWAQKNLTESILMTYEKFDTAFIKPEGLLQKNEIDAYVLDKSFINEIAKNNTDLEVLRSKFTEEKIGIAVSKKKPELVKTINQAMKKMRESGELKNLLKDLI